MKLGTDISEWGGDLDAATVECWKGQGVEYVIVQYSSKMQQHLQALTNAGMYGEMYVYLYWGTSPWNQTPLDRTNAALTVAKQFGVHRLWLDCEDTTHPFQPGQLQACIDACTAAGVAPGIYTGSWWWGPNAGNTSRFSTLPLWDANYLTEAKQADLSKMPQDFNNFRPYGGWTAPTIWQWSNTTSLCGHSCDLNAALGDAPAPVPTPTPAPVGNIVTGVTVHFSDGSEWALAVQPPGRG